MTIALTVYNSFGLVQLKFRFDPTHHVPENTHLSDYMHKVSHLYPDIGSEGTVLIGKINYTQDMPKLVNLAKEIEKQSNIIHQVDAWPLDFAQFVRVHYEEKGNFP